MGQEVTFPQDREKNFLILHTSESFAPSMLLILSYEQSRCISAMDFSRWQNSFGGPKEEAARDLSYELKIIHSERIYF